ncbi:phosphotransferase family protein [Nocardia brasiliensis]|uniref:Hygromycin-B kinase n=1 Tax=Nocardia brasiliensis (strain ATCC 700358 / HUJEG-1) TaxID=1133849 RepID=K0F1R0_NOCB7|nr:aminoglycoside phosphotransferase family protein [Nocardia brasiliensis]AFU03055.1 Hygromycin-B kinase [Nocardia brasiliensis ATCC 700358]OCF84628.1 hypothetical protein AW168_40380 [Nocardia brasiliensis]
MVSQPVRSAAEWTAGDVAGVLAQACPAARVTSIRPGPPSYSNCLWLAETVDGRLLVRIPGRSADPEYVRATVTATHLASAAGVPTVRYHEFVPQTPLGLPVTIQEYLPGESGTAALRADRADLRLLASTLGDWLGTLHGVRRETFGAVTGSGERTTWTAAATDQVETALRAVPEAALPASPATIAAAFARVVAELGPGEPASLVHGDLYLDNMLVDNGAPAALLDFEHAHYYDRFADFGKLSELLFEWWPGAEEPFLESYRDHFPPDPADEVRLRLGVGLYALNQTAYFARWQPELVGEYRTRLGKWLAAG